MSVAGERRVVSVLVADVADRQVADSYRFRSQTSLSPSSVRSGSTR